jgi:hypothetical protein
MTQRERQASGGVFDAPPKEVRAADRRPPAQAAPAAAGFPLWEELYRGASPAQQTELLALAERQGVVYAHQLPSPANGSPPSPDRARQLLTRLLAGQTDALPPFRAPAAPPGAVPLDEVQREAVARALETPDVCLIQGLPGTGKTHVVAEVVTRAAARGERVLLLAPTAAALDRVLEVVGGRDAVCAVRCLGRDERPESLPPATRGLLFAERARALKEHSLERATREVQQVEERLAGLRRAEPVWPRLEELAARHDQLAGQIQELAAGREAVAAAVEREATEGGAAEGFRGAVAGAARARDEALAEAQGRLEAARARVAEKVRERDELARRLGEVRSLAEAKQGWRFWRSGFWSALGKGDLAAEAGEVEARLGQAEKAASGLEEELRQAEAAGDEARAAFEAERARLTAAEVARRQGDLDDQREALEQERRQLGAKWQAAALDLGAEAPRPEGPTAAAVAAAREACAQRLRDAEERLAFARQWSESLREAAETLPARLHGYVNLVAATTTALHADEHFGDASARSVHFDLLVLEQAHEVTESEFLQAARRARRWVLVGEPVPAPEAGEREPRAADRGPRQGRRPPPRPALRTPPVFGRLWANLHLDPRRLPYRWRHEGGRLCCRLRHLSDDEGRSLESERVADSPDVELRIASPAGRAPFLAEVVFPGSVSVPEAKAYIFRELSELPVVARGHSLRWVEDADRLVLRLADVPAPDAVPVPLGNGVRVMVAELPGCEAGGVPWHTCCVEFERSAGWGWEKVEEWVHDHIGVRDLGRTVSLPTPHRMQAPLALFVSDLLASGPYHAPGRPAAPGQAAVEFVAVPPPGGPRGRGEAKGAPRPLPTRGGAGLESDLADARHADRLPAELRAGLPNRGLVNYLEAVAVVRALEGLAHAGANGASSVGVVALYPAQVDLVRLLIGRSAALCGSRLAVAVGTPGAFRGQEFDVVLLSLTRSHAHRAVTFGEGPHLLELALTRGRERLVVFGDAGTLARRGQWEGPVDHLDGPAASRERQLVAKLVEYLEGRGRHQDTFHLREGGNAP